MLAAGIVLPLLTGTGIQARASVQTMPDGGQFDPYFYYESNPDVAAAVGKDTAALYRHYLTYGKKEGRQPVAGQNKAAEGDIQGQQEAAPLEINGDGEEDNTDAQQPLQTGTTEVQDGAAPAENTSSLERMQQPAVSEFEQEVREYMNRSITPDMTTASKLRAVYDYMVDHTVYGRSLPKRDAAGTWMTRAARSVYEKGKGNCYQFAAAMGYCACELGFDATVQAGRVSRNTSGVVQHGWTIVTVDGQDYVIDAEMAYAHKNKDLFYLVKPENYPIPPLTVWEQWKVSF